MRQGNARIGSCKVGFVLAALAFAGAAWAGEVRSLALEHGATGTRAEIDLHGAGQYKTLSLAGPDRLVLDLPDSHAARSLKLPAPTGVVAAVRTGQPVPGTLRIVFELSAPVNALPLRVEPSADGARLAIHWPGDGTVPAPVVSALPQAAPVAAALDQLERLCASPTWRRWPGVELSVDLADLRGYHYHTGVMFAAYGADHPSALALGGRYDGLGAAFGRARPATGFSIDLRELIARLPLAPLPGAILAPSCGDEALEAVVAQLREAGQAVVRELPGHPLEEWREAGCDRRLVCRAGHWVVEPL